MSAEWKVRLAICIASVAIQAFTKLFSFSDVLTATNCTFQEVDKIYSSGAGGQYKMSCMGFHKA